MSTQPGWYDAEQPGLQRWWDGTAWTEHVRAVPVPPTLPAPVLGAAPMLGWYRVPSTGETRWFTGAIWSGYSLRDGVPRPDRITGSQRSSQGLVLAMLYVVIGVSQTLIGLNNRAFVASGLLFLLLGAFWLYGALRARRRERLPWPADAPVITDEMRPLPGEVEGPTAGWYPGDQLGRTRWWTGTRWSQYIAKAGEVEPMHGVERSLLLATRMGLGLLIAGVLVLTLGLVLVNAPGAGSPSVTIAVVGGALLFIGVLLWGVFLARYRALVRSQHRPVP
ncbi:DUF2510 domain-containing protein [Microbacterium sp. ZW T5_56]|uniref:DUF2510 domain-containing protein n=1 Tax=Microbacterium sp. ZW T5_56 TaxID=3378081 RepID=UPI003853530E